jgi:hypothetical protein
MAQRLFTPRSARKLLPEIRPLAERVCRLYRCLESSRPRQVASDARVDPTYFRLLVDLNHSLDEIGRFGARVRNPRTGLVDFPARREGRSVWLCWKVGESSLGFWHEQEAGFAGRRPVDEDGPWEEEETTTLDRAG